MIKYKQSGFVAEYTGKQSEKIIKLQAKVKQLEAENRWIPVSERLPKPCLPYPVSKDVLIISANEACQGYYQTNIRQWVIYGSHQRPKEYQNYITHWKPIILPVQALKANKNGKEER